MAFAFCSPKEKGFKKRTGRRIAQSRLAKRSVTVKYTKDDRPKKAMVFGLVEAALQRFVARSAFCEDTKAAEPDIFNHWFPHWLLRGADKSVRNRYYPNEQQRAQSVVTDILAKCEKAYEVHKAQVEEQKKRAAEKAAAADG